MTWLIPRAPLTVELYRAPWRRSALRYVSLVLGLGAVALAVMTQPIVLILAATAACMWWVLRLIDDMGAEEVPQ